VGGGGYSMGITTTKQISVDGALSLSKDVARFKYNLHWCRMQVLSFSLV
jgi:hypothetical protein